MSIAEYDVIIIGGGIVGCALARALAISNFKVAIIEQQELALPSLTSGYELRVSAITPSSQQFFKYLDVWQDIMSLRISPFDKMLVWEASSQARIEFAARQFGERNLGHIIENAMMQRALLNKLDNAQNVNVITGVSLHNMQVKTGQVVATLNTGQVLTAKLIVGADGISSKVRELAGIALDYQAYEQTAIVATVQCEKPHQRTARQCFLTDSILAFLPLLDSRMCSIVWSCNTDVAERLLRLDDLAFSYALQDVFGIKLGKIELRSKRLSFPLAMRHARHYVAPRIALVGDAAHTIHPLAGQGLNLGLADADYLAQIITTTKRNNRDIGLLANLRPYERWRKHENSRIIITMQLFKDMFASPLAPVVWLRAKGLHFVNKLPKLKHFFMRQANGRYVDRILGDEQENGSL